MTLVILLCKVSKSRAGGWNGFQMPSWCLQDKCFNRHLGNEVVCGGRLQGFKRALSWPGNVYEYVNRFVAQVFSTALFPATTRSMVKVTCGHCPCRLEAIPF